MDSRALRVVPQAGPEIDSESSAAAKKKFLWHSHRGVWTHSVQLRWYCRGLPKFGRHETDAARTVARLSRLLTRLLPTSVCYGLAGRGEPGNGTSKKRQRGAIVEKRSPARTSFSFLVESSCLARVSPIREVLACPPCLGGCRINFDSREGAAGCVRPQREHLCLMARGYLGDVTPKESLGARWRASRARRLSTCGPPRSGAMSACPTLGDRRAAASASNGRAFPPAQSTRRLLETLSDALKWRGVVTRRAALLHLSLRRAQRLGGGGDDRRRLHALLQRRGRLRGPPRRGGAPRYG